MPYILSTIISEEIPPLWGEGQPFKKELIYDIHSDDPKKPPVHYSAYTIKPHSMAHVDAPGHIIREGCDIDWFFKNGKLDGFYGRALVAKLRGNQYRKVESAPALSHWEVSLNELQDEFKRMNYDGIPDRLFITTDRYPEAAAGMHDQNFAFTLSEDAANFLVKNNNFCTFGTSWKSTDFQPGKRERPIHKILLSRKITIYECLNLQQVPAGEYVFFGFPLPFAGASESPVCPVLFTPSEIKALF